MPPTTSVIVAVYNLMKSGGLEDALNWVLSRRRRSITIPGRSLTLEFPADLTGNVINRRYANGAETVFEPPPTIPLTCEREVVTPHPRIGVILMVSSG